MYEYEFRVVVTCDEQHFYSFYNDILRSLESEEQCNFYLEDYRVFYVRPHFRKKEMNPFEWKQVLSTLSIYHDDLWFKLVESQEIPFEKWSLDTTKMFLKYLGHYSDPLTVEFRREMRSLLYPQLKIYAFRKNTTNFGVVFEIEIGNFKKRRRNAARLAACYVNHKHFSTFKKFYDCLRNPCFTLPRPRTLRGHHECSNCIEEGEEDEGHVDLQRGSSSSSSSSRALYRKQVLPLGLNNVNTLLATGATILAGPKHDGTFGFVHCLEDSIHEVWEDNSRRVHRNTSWMVEEPGGVGALRRYVTLVFGAEKMEDGSVVLLDVYRVNGSPVRTTEALLTEFLTRVPCLPSYGVQTYVRVTHVGQVLDLFRCLKNDSRYDGLVLHDVTNDIVYKIKSNHTIDLVHYDGFYLLPGGETIKIPVDECCSSSSDVLENGIVYECMPDTLRPIRKRKDRFIGNSAKQLSMSIKASGSMVSSILKEKLFNKIL